MYIVASDGTEIQTKKLKSTVSLPKAKMLIQNLRDTDYLGLEYWLEDDDGNEITVKEGRNK